MIELSKKEFDAWGEMLRENVQKRQELKEKLDADNDELLRSAGVDPEGDDLLIELPAAVIKKQEKLQNKYESALVALDQALSEKQSPIIQAGIDRAIRGKTLEAIYEDAKATIYSRAYDEMTTDGAAGVYELFGGTLSGSVDLNVDDHILELRNKGRVDLADDLQDLVDRYTAGEITRTEAEPYKGFEYIKVVVNVPKKKTVDETTNKVKVDLVAVAENNVNSNADLVKQIFAGSGKTTLDSLVIYTENKGKKNAVTKKAKAIASIDYEGLSNVTFLARSGYIGRFEKLVFDAVVSLYDAGNECMSVDMIANAMNGYKLTDSASEKQRQDIVDSLRKLSVTRVQIHTREIADLYPAIKNVMKESYILNADFVNVEYRGGTWETAIKVNQTPQLLQYAQALNQVVRKDIKLLAAPIQSNRENILLRGYLYERVINSTNRSNYNIITVDTILKELDISPDNYSSRSGFNNKRSKVVATATKILDYWKQESFIKGYNTETEKKGKHPTVIKFIIDK